MRPSLSHLMSEFIIYCFILFCTPPLSRRLTKVKLCGLVTEVCSNASQTGTGFNVPPKAQLVLVILTFVFGILEVIATSNLQSRVKERSSQQSDHGTELV